MKGLKPLETPPEFKMSFAEAKSLSDRAQSSEALAEEGMLHVPGGTYRMGSDRHYPEEAPIHRVTGYDTVMPLFRLEHDYIPSVQRIVDAVQTVLAD